MHAILLGMFMAAAPAPQVPQATIVTKLDALKAIGAQVERTIRSGGLDLAGASVTRELELELAVSPRR